MADLLAQYEEYLATEKHASQNTLSSYMRDLHQFAVYLDEFHPMPLPQVTQEVISGYVAWMGGKGKSAATITRSIASIKSLYTYLQMTGEVSANPAKGVAAVKVEHKFPEILTGKEVELFLDQPQCVDAKGYRDHAMLELLYATGIRVSELGDYSMEYDLKTPEQQAELANVVRFAIDRSRLTQEHLDYVIAAVKATDADKAKKMIEAIVKEPEPGEIYYGKVVRLMNFGAFVEIAPGKEGLVHISKLDTKRVERVEDVVAVGDAIVVKVTDIDQQGRINLSRRDAILALEAKKNAQQ